jgi:hypothetical protein
MANLETYKRTCLGTLKGRFNSLVTQYKDIGWPPAKKIGGVLKGALNKSSMVHIIPRTRLRIL